MLSRLLFLELKSEHRNEAVHSALLPTGLRVPVDPRESGRQALLVRTCPQANTRESTSRRQRDRGATGRRAALCGRVWTTGGRAAGSRVTGRQGVRNGTSALRRRWCLLRADPL